MKKIKVTLLHYTPLEIADKAIGKCWDKQKEVCDVERIDRVANKHKHSSTIEHLYYNFDIDGVSRALLQELARHRISSFSVKSTRYTLKELKKEYSFIRDEYGSYSDKDIKRASKYILLTGDEFIDSSSIDALDNLIIALKIKNISNDIAKYALPEAYRTSLVWSINARSLQNFLSLRTDKAALWEIRHLAHLIYNALPEEHKFLFKPYVKFYEDK